MAQILCVGIGIKSGVGGNGEGVVKNFHVQQRIERMNIVDGWNQVISQAG